MPNQTVYYFYLTYLISSAGQHVGSGTDVTSNRDPKEDSRQGVINKVIQELKVKHPDKQFAITIYSVKKHITAEEAQGRTIGWDITFTEPV